jgi:putative aldouronate transport system permease protein
MQTNDVSKQRQMPYARKKIHLNKIGTKIWADRYMYLMILPVVIYYIVFKYWPMAWLRIAFYDFKILKGIAGSKFIGFENFRTFLNNPNFLQIIWNTLYLNILSLIFVFTAPIIFALLINELSVGRFKRTIQTISYLPHFLSTVVVVSMITTFLSPSIGSLNAILKKLGFDTIYFLGNSKYFRTIMLISGIWQGMGWNSIVYLSALAGINVELYESAIIDGANRFQQVLHVTLPGIANTIIIMLILQIGNLLTVGFEKVYLLQNAQNMKVSEVLSTYVYKMGLVRTNYSLGTAVGLFNSVISLILVLLANKLSKKYSEISLI